MSNKGQMLQDPFLNTLRKEHVQVSIYLVNGIKLQGQIESFDQYVVLLKNTYEPRPAVNTPSPVCEMRRVVNSRRKSRSRSTIRRSVRNDELGRRPRSFAITAARMVTRSAYGG